MLCFVSDSNPFLFHNLFMLETLVFWLLHVSLSFLNIGIEFDLGTLWITGSFLALDMLYLVKVQNK